MKRCSSILSILLIGLICLLIASKVYTYVTGDILFTTTTIYGESMESNFSDGDFGVILMAKKIERGDIVIIDHDAKELDGRLIIKRVIGLPGDEIEFREGKLFINEEVMKEDYLSLDYTKNFEKESSFEWAMCRDDFICEDGKFTVPFGSYFVLGDNRDNSFDSRELGFIKRDEIIAKNFIKLYNKGDLNRRIGWFIKKMRDIIY